MYRIEFADGGNPEYRILHRGTKEDCEHVMTLTPAVAYSGPRQPIEARIGVFQDSEISGK